MRWPFLILVISLFLIAGVGRAAQPEGFPPTVWVTVPDGDIPGFTGTLMWNDDEGDYLGIAGDSLSNLADTGGGTWTLAVFETVGWSSMRAYFVWDGVGGPVFDHDGNPGFAEYTWPVGGTFALAEGVGGGVGVDVAWGAVVGAVLNGGGPYLLRGVAFAVVVAGILYIGSLVFRKRRV